MIKINKTQSSSPIRCGICHREIMDISSIHQSVFSSSIICEKCYTMFDANEIDLLLNMFIAYGGYFGEKGQANFPIMEILKEIIKDLQNKSHENSLEVINIKMLHTALLHGISPKQFSERFSELVNN